MPRLALAMHRASLAKRPRAIFGEKITQTMTTLLLEIENPQDLETLVPLLRRLQIKFSTTETTGSAKSKPNGKSHEINDLQRLLLAAPDLNDEALAAITAKRNALNQWKPSVSTLPS